MTFSASMAVRGFIRERFIKDLDDICASLIKAGSIRFNGSDPSLSSPLMRWLDFRLRMIEPRKRVIAYSRDFPRVLPAQAIPALEEIKRRIRVGEDIGSYQSARLLAHDVSGKKKKNRTDFMWANWGIHHLHLSLIDTPGSSGFKPRADYLLFCVFDNETAAFLDIRRHDETDVFSNPDIVENLIKTFPDYAAQFELNGVLPGNERYSSAELKRLWRAGISTPMEVNGKVYMGPGGGVSTAATSTRATGIAIRIRALVRELADAVMAPDGSIQEHVRSLGVLKPQFELALTEKGIVIYEAGSTFAWCKPREDCAMKTDMNALAELNQRLLPDWLVRRFCH